MIDFSVISASLNEVTVIPPTAGVLFAAALAVLLLVLSGFASGSEIAFFSLSPSDLFPAFIRKELVQPYALKALPVVLVWLKLCFEMMTKDYATARAFR